MQQTDVKSAHLSAAGSFYAGRTRLKGLSIAPAASTATTFEIRDGSATGIVLVQIDLPSNSNPNSFYIAVPGEGILAQAGLYLTQSVGGVAGIAVFYG
jgi:hypothetical protein